MDVGKTLYEVFDGYSQDVKKNEEYFRNLWERSSDQYEWFKFAVEACGYNPADKELFMTGWQYRTVNHEDYKQAKVEFVNLCMGWW